MFVAVVEVAPLDHRNAHRAEVADARGEEIADRMILRRHRPSLDLERDAEAISAQRQRIYRARRLHSRHRLEPALQIDEKLALPVAVVFDLGQAQVEGKNVLGLKTAIHVSQAPQTLNQ